jgi:hypothetical protein
VNPNFLVCTAGAALLLVVAPLAWAQPVLDGTEVIDFDRPEAWAMKRSASLTLFTALGPPRDRDAGSIELAFELGWNPSLSEEERQVGFNGTKVEDLNRLAVVPRPRVTVGLGHNWSLDAAYIPPIEVEGITPSIVSLAIERPLWRRDNWVIGVRGYGQVGVVKGDITCTEDEAAIPPGEPDNAFGCETPSEDEVTLNYAGLGLTGGYRFPGDTQSALHFGAFANYMDLEFQVDALTYGVRDRTTLLTDGWTYSLTAGFSWALGRPTRLAVEALYSPLAVDRVVIDDGEGNKAVEPRNDALFNLRAMLSYVF